MSTSPDISGTRWRVRPEVAVVENDGRITVLALDSRDPAPLTFDGTGAQVWKALAQHRRFDAVVHALSEDYRTDERHLSADVAEFMIALERADLIERLE